MTGTQVNCRSLTMHARSAYSNLEKDALRHGGRKLRDTGVLGQGLQSECLMAGPTKISRNYREYS